MTLIPKKIVDPCLWSYDMSYNTGVREMDDLVRLGKAVKYKYGEHLKINAGNFLASTKDKNGDLICYKAKEDFHSIATASTGLGKTQGYILPSLMNLTGKESAVVVGPKGEEVKYTYNYLTSIYGKENVEILNFTSPKNTTVYYNPLFSYADRYVKSFKLPPAQIKEEQDQIFGDLRKLIEGTFPIRTHQDISWDIGSRQLLEAIAIGCINDCSEEFLRANPIRGINGIRRKLTPQEVTFKTIEEIFSEFVWATEGGALGDKAFFAERLKDKRAKNKAQTALGATSMGTRSSYLSLTSSFLAEHTSPKVNEISKYHTLDFSSYQERPKVLYVLYDMSDSVLREWTNDVVRNFIIYLKDEAISSMAGKLKIKTLFFIDEFTSLKPERIYPQILAIGRGHGIFLNLCIQSDSQLKTAYGDAGYTTIVENCNVKYFLGSNNADTVKSFMTEIGNVEKLSEEDLFHGIIRKKEQPRISFDKLMFGMSAGDCYVKMIYQIPAYVKLNFFYNTPEYTKYPPFDVFSVKAPKIPTIKPITNLSSEECDKRYEDARIALEKRRKEILRRMQEQIEKEAEEDFYEYDEDDE